MATTDHETSSYWTFTKSTIPVESEPLFGQENDSKWKVYGCFLCRVSSSLLLHPKGPFRNIWDLVVLVVLLYTSFEVPVSIAFGQSVGAKYFDLIIDIFLLTDIILNFHTAYFDKYDNLHLVTDKKLIAKKYVSGSFLIDFITCIPFEFLTPEADNEYSNHPLSAIKILRIFRLLRLLKILRFFKSFKFLKHSMAREVAVFLKIFKITFLLLLFAHFAACLWWYVGIKNEPSWIDDQEIQTDLRTNENGFQNYSFAWYWAIVTIFTTGYGDIHATNSTEQWVTTLCILIGTGFHAYFISTLTGLITKGDTVKGHEYKTIEMAQAFCESKKLPKYLAHAILTHIQYHCKYNYLFDETEILDLLPEQLQRDIQSYAAKQFLQQLDIFQNEKIKLPEFIIGLIAVKVKSISCHQGFKLFDIGDIAKNFYIQRTGKSVMYSPNEEELFDLSRGNVFGEYSSILFKKRRCRIECTTWCEFYSINCDDIKQVLDIYYPKSSKSKWRRIQSYLKNSYNNKIKHYVEINKVEKQENELYRQYDNTVEMDRTLLITNEKEFKKNNSQSQIGKKTPIMSAVKPAKKLTKQLTKKILAPVKSRRDSVVRNEAIIRLGQKYTPKSSLAEQPLDTNTIHSADSVEMTAFKMPSVNNDNKIDDNDDSECSFSSIPTDIGQKNDYQKQIIDTIRNNEDDQIEKDELEELNLDNDTFGGNETQMVQNVDDKSVVVMSENMSIVTDQPKEIIDT